MPVSIDTVYQRVLSIANKEQRGYITPLEFNLLANQAQLDIFEQYFYDLNQFERRQKQEDRIIDVEDTSFSDMPELIKNKLAIFTTVQGVGGGTTFPTNYRTGRIFVLVGSVNYEAKLIDINDVRNLLDSEFHRSGLRKNPVYIESNMSGSDIEVYNHNGLLTTGISCEIIVPPNKVEWGYDVIAEKALYNASNTIDFELHDSEETNLVLKTLELSGIILNKPGLVQIADQEGIKKTQQQKM